MLSKSNPFQIVNNHLRNRKRAPCFYRSLVNNPSYFRIVMGYAFDLLGDRRTIMALIYLKKFNFSQSQNFC